MTEIPKRNSQRKRLLFVVALLPCLYLLSTGPVAAVAQKIGGRTVLACGGLLQGIEHDPRGQELG